MWNDSTITDAGRVLIARSVGGETLTIKRARIGSGTVQATKLHSQTDITNPVKYVNISEQKRVSDGVECSLVVTPEANEFVCRQVGLFASIGAEAETMIAIYQDNTGFAVPADVAEFMYKFNAIIAVDESADIVVNVDTSAFVTAERLNTVADELRGEISAVRATANGKQDAIADLDAIRYGVNTVTNPNLLDNWFFYNPVNQRGLTSATTSGVFIVDRWSTLASSSSYSLNVTLANNRLNIVSPAGGNTWMNQKIPNFERLSGRKATFSVYISGSSNGLYYATMIIGDDDYTTICSNPVLKARVTSSGFMNFYVGAGYTASILGVKLELGERQTMCHKESGIWYFNEIPNQGDQLRRCQMFFIKSSKQQMLYPISTATLKLSKRTTVSFPEKMYSEPSVVLSWYNNKTPTGTVNKWAFTDGFMVAVDDTTDNAYAMLLGYTATVSGYGG